MPKNSANASDAARERALLLVQSIADVAPPGHPLPLPLADASPAHRALYRDYIAELGDAVDDASTWWEGRITTAMQRHRRSRERAERDQLAVIKVGPAFAGRVVAAVRQGWLRCAALNATLAESQRVPPEQLVLGWLIDTEPALVAVLGRWTYLPVGLDASGHWI